MSAELLFNFDKSSTKKLGAQNNIPKQNGNEKKEGTSLFDSLLNEAQKGTSETKSENKNNTKTQEKSNLDIKTKSTASSEEQLDESSSEKSKNIASSEKISSKQNVNEKVNDFSSEKSKNIASVENISFKENVDTKVDKSLQKMIDKLVDIIVSSAKEIKENKSSQNDVQSEIVKDKINQLLGSKNLNSSMIQELKEKVDGIINDKTISKNLENETIKTVVNKFLVDDKLIKGITNIDDIKNAISAIKENVENVSTKNQKISNTLENVEKKSDKNKDQKNISIIENIKNSKEDISTSISTSPKLETQKNDIKTEVITIEKNIKNLSKGIENSSNEEIKVLIETIDGDTRKIENTIKDIKSLVTSIEIVENKDTITVAKEVKEIPNKIELNVDLLKENISNIEEEVSKVVIVKTTGDIIETKDTKSIIQNILSDSTNKESKNPLLASMFLQSQTSMKETTSLSQIKEAKETILDNKTLESVKKSAQKLDLNLEKTEVESEGDVTKPIINTEVKKDEPKNNTQSNRFLNQVFLNQKIEENYKNTEELRTVQVQKEVQKSVELDMTNKNEKTNIVEMSVPKDVIQILQTKIIGAQQKMGGFMSEVARNMYLNYKPPMTAFRVNLNPANLGSISVIMKANKVDNSLTVSMNLSNSNTMESFIENKATLQNAIQKQFNDSSNVSIDFGMQNQNSENSFTQSDQKNKQSNQNNQNNDNLDTEIEEEQEIVVNNDYM